MIDVKRINQRHSLDFKRQGSEQQPLNPPALDRGTFLKFCRDRHLTRDISALLRRLSTNTYRQYQVTRQGISGTVNWTKTFQARISSGLNDGTIFVTAENYKDTDTPPNRCLKFLLTKISLLAAEELTGLETGGQKAPRKTDPPGLTNCELTAPPQAKKPNLAATDLLTLKKEAEALLASPRLKKVLVPRHLNAGDVNKLCAHKEKLYRSVGEACQEYLRSLA
jgi:hypothetical protein